jgi:type I restriction enzyme S subunit
MKQGLLHDLLTRGIDEHGELRDPERHPEQFKDSALGRIPRGWEVGPLEDWLCGLPRNGYSPKAVDGWTGSMMLGLGCLTPNGFEARQLKNAPRNDAQLQRALLHPGDLLLSRSNTRDLVGLAGVYESIGAPCIYPDLMMRLSPADTTSSRFLEQILRSLQVRRQIQAAASGTSGSMVKISAAIVRRLLVAMPEMHEQGVIIGTLDRATELVDQEKAETLKLRTLKHGLMDDLLTGRVRVSVPKEANP